MRKISILFVCLLIFILLSDCSQQRQQKGSVPKHEPETPGAKEKIEGLDVGKQHLVLIAIDDYKEWPSIKGPVEDADKLEKVLTTRYHFDEVKKFYNSDATKAAIRNYIISLQQHKKKELQKNDSLFLFYSGHGKLFEEETDNGYWIPNDGGQDNNARAKWFSNSELIGLLKQIKSDHILIVSDSCFAGTLVETHKGDIDAIDQKFLIKIYPKRSRKVLTSGDLEYVPARSIFAQQFIQSLEENKDPFIDISSIYMKIEKPVYGSTGNLPRFGNLKGTDYEANSRFILFTKEGWEKKPIEVEGPKKKKKKFPWVLTVGATIVGGVVAYLLLNKKPDSPDYSNYDTNVLGIEWIDIPAGEFLMGDNFEEGNPDELPVHSVYLDSYKISKYEVTFDQYDRFCEETNRNSPDDSGWGKGNRPVINVSWNDANAFCYWLSQKTGKNIHLPTEAQWEKAARGTDQRRFPWGNGDPSCDILNYESCLLGKTEPVGSYPLGVSSYGVHDMSGNVYEWCQDWYSSNYYLASPTTNPTGPLSGTDRVNRGGSWDNSYFNLRAANRHAGIPTSSSNKMGFRIVQE